MKALSRFLASPARTAIVLGLVCTGLVGASFFVEHLVGIEPCPLCIIQRYAYVGLMPVFFGAAMAPDHGRAQRTLFWSAAILTLGGLGIAGHQTYLQLNPAPLAARCSASLTYMLDSMAVTEVLSGLLHATGDCSDASFKVLGLTLAQASLLVFLGLTVSLAMLLRRRPASAQGRA
jgi:protein dithiol:quinone oxidoreductase